MRPVSLPLYPRTMTESEILFEKILSELGVDFYPIPKSLNSGKQTPDYQILLDGEDSYWEVKELEENDEENSILSKTINDNHEIYSVDSERIKYSIIKACKQFKFYKVTHKPCIIVVYDSRDFAVMDFLFYQYVQKAMLGRGEYIQNQDGTFTECKRTGALLTTKNKKYVSAIAIIIKNSKKMVFFHNPNANISLLNSDFRNIFKNNYKAIFTIKGLEWVKI